ncbi:MAG: AAA family ATPase, partial [Eubacterium sp.]
MIKREQYLKRIRPFYNKELVKVLTGMRRSGKSVMLELIKEELIDSGIKKEQLLHYNFEQLSNAAFCTALSLHKELTEKIASIQGKVYLFFDEIQEVRDWEKAINSFRIDFDCDIYI